MVDIDTLQMGKIERLTIGYKFNHTFSGGSPASCLLNLSGIRSPVKGLISNTSHRVFINEQEMFHGTPKITQSIGYNIGYLDVGDRGDVTEEFENYIDILLSLSPDRAEIELKLLKDFLNLFVIPQIKILGAYNSDGTPTVGMIKMGGHNLEHHYEWSRYIVSLVACFSMMSNYKAVILENIDIGLNNTKTAILKLISGNYKKVFETHALPTYAKTIFILSSLAQKYHKHLNGYVQIGVNGIYLTKTNYK